MSDVDHTVRLSDKETRINVDTFDDGVWLAINMNRSSARTVLTKDEAKELIDALNKIVNHLETVEQ